MLPIVNPLKGAAAVSAVALALCLTANTARAEAKNTTNWNSSSFGAACNASPRCIGSSDGTKGQIYGDDGSVTNVRCSSNSCSYSTTPGGGGGSPARVARHSKQLGIDGLLGQSQVAPAQSKKLDVGQKIPVQKIDTPKVNIPRAAADVPKVLAPAASAGTKDIKVR